MLGILKAAAVPQIQNDLSGSAFPDPFLADVGADIVVSLHQRFQSFPAQVSVGIIFLHKGGIGIVQGSKLLRFVYQPDKFVGFRKAIILHIFKQNPAVVGKIRLAGEHDQLWIRLGEGISKGSIACFTQLMQHLPGQSRLFVFHEITILVSVFFGFHPLIRSSSRVSALLASGTIT